ncbi:MAG: hypothetical protein GY950_31985 [bacterium]|nr:hypothetical protein [bacterium]
MSQRAYTPVTTRYSSYDIIGTVGACPLIHPYAFVNFEEERRYKNRFMPKAEVYHSWEDVKMRLEHDHQEAMSCSPDR